MLNILILYFNGINFHWDIFWRIENNINAGIMYGLVHSSSTSKFVAWFPLEGIHIRIIVLLDNAKLYNSDKKVCW